MLYYITHLSPLSQTDEGRAVVNVQARQAGVNGPFTKLSFFGSAAELIARQKVGTFLDITSGIWSAEAWETDGQLRCQPTVVVWGFTLGGMSRSAAERAGAKFDDEEQGEESRSRSGTTRRATATAPANTRRTRRSRSTPPAQTPEPPEGIVQPDPVADLDQEVPF